MPSAAPPLQLDLGSLEPERHVVRAVDTARILAGDAPVDARIALLAAALVARDSRSDAFSVLGVLLEKAGLPDVAPAPARKRGKGGPAVDVSEGLARAFERARPFLADGQLWGRDWVTVALTAVEDPSLGELGREAGRDPEELRHRWREFLAAGDTRREAEEWERWWSTVPEAAAPLASSATEASSTPDAPSPTDTPSASDHAPGPDARGAYLLTWNPRRDPFPALEELEARIAEGETPVYPWSTGNRTSMERGARVFLLRQGEEPRGIVGSGTVAGAVERRPHWDPKRREAGDEANLADVTWEVLSREPVLVLDRLVEITGEEKLWGSAAGGVHIPPDVQRPLVEAWRRATAMPTVQSPHPDGVAYLRRLRPDARDVIAAGWALAQQTGRSTLHMEHLVAGLVRGGRPGPDGAPDPSGAGMLQPVLDAAGVAAEDTLAALAPPHESPFPPTWSWSALEALPPLSSHARRAVHVAEQRAEALRNGAVDAPDLANGAFSVADCSVIQRLRSRGLAAASLPWRWEPPVRLAGYWSDSTSGTDLLDMTREARVLATIMASGQVEPPLSIGLFGPWGSGKSFFMKLLRREVHRAQRSPSPDTCKRIVQIHFNAWHYIDSNLWASLANEVFERLGREIEALGAARAAAAKQGEAPGDGDDPADPRAWSRREQKQKATRLLMAARQSRDELAEAVQRKERAEAGLESAEAELSQLQQERWMLQGPVHPDRLADETLRQVLADDDARAKLDRALSALHLSTRDVSPEALERRLERWKGWRGWVLGWWHAVRGRGRGLRVGEPGRRLGRRYTATALAVALAVLLADPWGWLDVMGAWLEGAAASVALLAGALAPWWDRMKALRDEVRPVVDTLDRAQGRARDVLEKESRARQRLHEERLERARAEERARREELTELEQELKDLLTDANIGAFVKDRRESRDYRQHLGVIAQARQDFQRLSELLRRRGPDRDLIEELMSEAEEVERRRLRGYRDELPDIDRIVLYIDDLDRCPEDKVVDVLQAVHLLLAFELFVVVVGVDPRWLLHSLADRSDVFREPADDRDRDGGNGAGLDRRRNRYWRTTPMDYLEKIFQIPFHLRPLGEQGYGDLVAALTRDAAGAGDGRGSTEAPSEGSGKDGAGPGRGAAGTGTGSRGTSDDASGAPGGTAAGDGARQEGKGAGGADPRQPAAGGGPTADGAQSGTADRPAVTERGAAATEQGATKAAVEARGEGATGTATPTRDGTPAQPSDEGAPETAAGAGDDGAGAEGGDDGTGSAPTPRLTIGPRERRFIQALHPFIESPRSAKRFVNLYRLVRASHVEPLVGPPPDVDGDEEDAEDGGPHQQVLFLLGMLTGFPGPSMELFRRLEEATPTDQSWGAFRLSLADEPPPPVGGVPAPGAPGADGRRVGDGDPRERRDWAAFLDALERAGQELEERQLYFDPPVSELRSWLPTVSRYSFRSGAHARGV